MVSGREVPLERPLPHTRSAANLLHRHIYPTLGEQRARRFDHRDGVATRVNSLWSLRGHGLTLPISGRTVHYLTSGRTVHIVYPDDASASTSERLS